MSTQPTQPQSKPVEAKPAAGASELQNAVRGVLDEVLPALMAVQKASASQPTYVGPRGRRDPGPRCTVCGQFRSACKDEHAQMVVLPRDEYAEFFTGVTINGVKYLSSSQSAVLSVPKDSVSTIQFTIQQFEEQERINKFGHPKQGGDGLGTVKNPRTGARGWR